MPHSVPFLYGLLQRVLRAWFLLGTCSPSIRAVLVGSVLLFAGGTLPAAAQEAGSRCDVAETKQFDFWVGTWDLSWGENGTGTNRIRRILDGCVIEESFEGTMNDGPYHGLSISVYDTKTGLWKQTWVDDQGGYLDFTGGVENGRMILSRTTTDDEGETVHQRMVWHDIEDDRFLWDWERSTDGGDTWETLWSITYTRRSGTP